MLFDLRGRRKRVIQVIYVMLAVIMAASLVVIGMPGGMNPFSDGSNSIDADVAKANIERAEDLEAQLQAQPNNQEVAVELIRARFSAGQALMERDATELSGDTISQYQKAAETWNRYLKMSKGNPDPAVAQLMAANVFGALLGQSTVSQFLANARDAAKAQQFVVDAAVKEQADGGASPVNQLAVLAQYHWYAQDYEAGDKTRQQTLAATDSAVERKQMQQSLDAARKEAKRIGRQIDKALKEAKKSGGSSLDTPVDGFGSG